MASADYQKGYNDAVEQLRKMMQGGGDSSQNGMSGTGQQNKQNQGGGGNKNQQQQSSTGTDGSPMQAPELNDKDAKKAKEASQGQSQASKKARQAAADAGTPMGGFVSQEVGAEIAKSEGYSAEDCKEESDSAIHHKWQEAAIEACSKANNPGFGGLISKIKDMYITKHDWKGELKRYIGKALNDLESDSKYGKRKWLAQDEIKKFDKPKGNALSDVVFMIDCSGSVSDDLLKRLMSECYTIVKKRGISDVTYAYYDDGITQVDVTKNIKEADKIPGVIIDKIKKGMGKAKDVHGRGGNNETKALEDILKLLKHSKKEMQLMMWFTDGYTYSVPKRPKKEVKNMIWVVYDNPDFKAPDDTRVIRLSSKDIGAK